MKIAHQHNFQEIAENNITPLIQLYEAGGIGRVEENDRFVQMPGCPTFSRCPDILRDESFESQCTEQELELSTISALSGGEYEKIGTDGIVLLDSSDSLDERTPVPVVRSICQVDQHKSFHRRNIGNDDAPRDTRSSAGTVTTSSTLSSNQSTNQHAGKENRYQCYTSPGPNHNHHSQSGSRQNQCQLQSYLQPTHQRYTASRNTSESGSVRISPDSLHRGNHTGMLSPAASHKKCSPDEKALRIGMLLSEQEQQFGFNMYDIPRTEEDIQEIARLSHLHGCTEDEALMVVFEKRYRSFRPKLTKLQQQQQQLNRDKTISNSNSNNNSYINSNTNSNTNGSSNSNPVSSSSKINDCRDDLVINDENKASKTHSRAKSKSFVMRTISFFSLSSQKHSSSHSLSSLNSPDLNGRAEKAKNAREERRIQKKFKYKTADVDTLMRMGFSRDQSVQALIENHNNIHEAANILLRS